MSKRRRQRINPKQKRFLKVYDKYNCNISKTCSHESVDITRATYYNWRKKNSRFDEECQHIEESLLDFAESMLQRNIFAGKEASIFFYLKTKGKERGYIERHDVGLEQDAFISAMKFLGKQSNE